MRISELHAPASVRDDAYSLGRNWNHYGTSDSTLEIRNALSKYGFEFLSAGVNGVVAKHPKYPYVIKAWSNDPAYLDWIQICRKHPSNPYLPRIKGGIVQLDLHVWAVRLESLHFKDESTQREAAKQFRHAYHEYTGNQQGNEFRESAGLINPGDYDYLVDDPDLYEVFNLIKNSGHTLDMHEGNIMWRSDQMVIIDPIM